MATSVELSSPATLEGLGTAVPPHRIAQAEIKQRAQEAFADLPGVERYLEIYDRAGVETRYFASPPEWYLEPHTWAERNQRYQHEALELLERAARQALEASGQDPRAVDTLIVVSTTGLATPSLDAHLAQRLGLSSAIRRVPVWGLGCAGGVAGLGLAADLARTSAGGVTLVAAVELCSLHFERGDRSLRHLVATSLFGDGAAAAVLAPPGRGAGPRLRARHSHLFPNSFDVMGWDVLDEGLKVVLSARLPEVVREGLGAAADPILRVAAGRLQHAPHPGGPKVLDAYADALRLDPHHLDVSRRVLAEFGNMSSPTAYFVLQEALRASNSSAPTPILSAAFGPGFSAEFVLVDPVAV